MNETYQAWPWKKKWSKMIQIEASFTAENVKPYILGPYYSAISWTEFINHLTWLINSFSFIKDNCFNWILIIAISCETLFPNDGVVCYLPKALLLLH